jgi:putative redox protein
MPSRTVEAVWEGGMRCQVDAGQFGLTVDEPVAAGGTDAGPQPTDLFLASVASCFTLAVSFAARKAGATLTDLRVTATGEYAGPRFASITVTVHVGFDEDGDLDALVAHATRVCYVTNTLRDPPTLDVVVERGA